MQDLAQLGLLGAPHVSAGRLPTHAGLRLFVDGLLEVGDLGEEERRDIEARLHAHGRSFEEALNEASSILSGLAGGAGVVVTPIARRRASSTWSSCALGGDRTLVVMVFEDGAVENRLMRLAAGVTPSALQEASNFLERPAARPHARRGRGRPARRTRPRPARAGRDRRAAGRGRAGGLGRRRGRGAGADRARPRQPAGRSQRDGGPGAGPHAVRRSGAEGAADRSAGRGRARRRACAFSSAPKRGCSRFRVPP